MLQITEENSDMYKNVVVRIQFPDNVILQGIFQPTDTVEHIMAFIKQYLRNPECMFNICKYGRNKTLT